jgi:hypothetical protein
MFANGGIVLTLLLIRGFFVPLVLFHVGQDARFFAGLGEPPQGLFKGLSWSNDYAGHSMLNSPLFRFLTNSSGDKGIKRASPCQEIPALKLESKSTGGRMQKLC